MEKRFYIVSVLLISCVVYLFSADTRPVRPDGYIRTGEYSDSEELSKAEIFWNINGDKIGLAVKASTKGWIALGLNSLRMDSSSIFMGYVKNGETYFEEQLGRGHAHLNQDNDKFIRFALSENDGVTVMEIELLMDDYLTPEQLLLAVIVAYGSADRFTSMHRYRDNINIILQREIKTEE